MSHNLHIDANDKASFFSVKEKAWHGLGTIIEDYPTSAEAIVYSGLDYEVVKQPNIHRLTDGTELISEKSFFTYRTDNNVVLGDKLGSDYKVVQNVDAFKFFDSIVGGDEGIMFETAGALHNGEVAFITAKLPSYIKVGQDDWMENYLFLTTSHDGTGSIAVGFTPIRIVCNNTMSFALNSCENKIKIRHSKNVQQQMDQAKKILGIVNTLPSIIEGCFKNMVKVKLNERQTKKFIALNLAPDAETINLIKNDRWEDISTRFSNVINSVEEYAHAADSQLLETTKGTLFGAYNAVTGYFQNIRSYNTNGNVDLSKKIENNLFGSGMRTSEAAFKMANGIYTNNTVSQLN